MSINRPASNPTKFAPMEGFLLALMHLLLALFRPYSILPWLPEACALSANCLLCALYALQFRGICPGLRQK